MRLIDADKLKTDLEKAISKNEDMDCLDFLRAASVIDAHPTAYDVDEGCAESRKEWLNSEYVDPEVEWSKIPVDTPILVRDSEDEEWKKRYFNKYSNGTVCAWSEGMTSWSADGENDYCEWDYAKLADDVEKPKDNGWHNLKDKKPEDKQEVLTWDGLGVREDRWSDDADYFESTDAKEIWWRQMPEPPEV